MPQYRIDGLTCCGIALKHGCERCLVRDGIAAEVQSESRVREEEEEGEVEMR